MRKVSKTMLRAVRAALLLLAINVAFSCANNSGNPTAAEAAVESTTVTGIVKAVTNGKDGYTADVQTETGGNYAALVSIVNLGGRERYKTCAVGDAVSFKGEATMLGDAQQLKVTEIISIAPAQTQGLDAKYRDIEPGANCWQVSKEVNLYTQPSASSKIEGMHFQGELLEVLGTQIVDDQLWVNVTYKLKVKAGYEGQFADGQVMSMGLPTGWIGGAVVPEINCK